MVVRRLRKATRWIRKIVFRVVFLALLVCVGLVAATRWINPPITYLMAREWSRTGQLDRDWIAIEDMSPHLLRSAVAAEDANFCKHYGFDMDGIRAALADRSRLRGGSTITQQVAKNVFLWPHRTWIRKGLEAGFAVLIEMIWPKQRILEVYLNVAEMGEGVFGVEAASKKYWNQNAADLGPLRSSRLMAILPAPRSRSPISGSASIERRARAIRHGAETIRVDGRAACFEAIGG